MKELGIRNITLLSMGAKMMGTMREAYFYAEESLYIDEAEDIFDFCEWVDDNIGSCSEYNMEQLFQAFKNPDNEELQAFANNLKTEIARIRGMM